MTKIFDEVKRLFCSSLDEIEPIFGESAIYEIELDGVKYEVFSNLKRKSSRFYIFNPAAVDYSIHSLPIFHRWSYAVESPYSCITLNDPTLYLGLCTGWFQGTENRYYLPTACNIVKTFAEKINCQPENMLFMGSSAGGFSSMMMSASIPDSSAFVINPQTDITRHGDCQALLDKCFSGISKEKASEDFGVRFSVTEYFRSVNNIPKIYYLQNPKDHARFSYI